MERVLALLYDIHGNLPALEAVLADAGDAGELLLGGDYATAGAWPRETVERLKELENATWIRGNADRWLADRHDAPAPIDEIAARTAELLGDELVAELVELPEQTEIGDTLYCHASPRSDMQSFGAEPGPLDNDLLEGVAAKRVVFGHTHVQFQRDGRERHRAAQPRQRRDALGRRPSRRLRGDRRRPRRAAGAWSTTGRPRSPRCESGSASCPARRMELARFDVRVVLACRPCASPTS